MADFDLAIIGGGINGVGIARDAAGRGIKVLLIEQHDLASGTSSASSKLIHGGLRYLQYGAFRLVREGLRERTVLMRVAPHLVHPRRFVLPTLGSDKPAWQLRLGLFIYDWLGGRGPLPGTRKLDLNSDPAGAPLRRRYTTGLEYSDCWTDDSRLVVVNALGAAELGASIRTRTRCIRVERGEVWTLVLNARGRRDVATARVLVNATGPWLANASKVVLRDDATLPLRLVKGSHIVVPKMFDHDRAYILPTRDNRIVFAMPFQDDYTLIGTTDQDFSGDPDAPTVDMAEINYLCNTANDYFRRNLSPGDVVWAFAGVRALYNDHAAAAKDTTRDYVLTLDEPLRIAPLLTVYGGKITTYRRLAEAALARLGHFFAMKPPWTAAVPLPGGEIEGTLDAWVAEMLRRWPYLAEAHARRLALAYGARAADILGDATSPDDLGPWLGADLTGAEVRYLMQREWAESADDVLWRRSKLGLRLSREEREALDRFMVGSLGPGRH